MSKATPTGLKVGLDFTGVVADPRRLMARICRQKFGIRIPAKELRQKIAVADGRISKHRYARLKEIVYETKEGLKMDPVPGALHFIRLLVKTGVKVRIVTSKNPSEVKTIRHWLRTHVPDYHRKVHVFGVGRRRSKSIATSGLGVFVDDSAEKLKKIRNGHHRKKLVSPKLFLFSRVHNQKELLGNFCTRVNGWSDLYRRIKALCSEEK